MSWSATKDHTSVIQTMKGGNLKPKIKNSSQQGGVMVQHALPSHTKRFFFKSGTVPKGSTCNDIMADFRRAFNTHNMPVFSLSQIIQVK